MKKIFLFFLTFFISSQVFSQYTRFRLNQIQGDTTAGSIVLSSFADSNMTYSRDFYIQDSVLILFGDTITAGSSSYWTKVVNDIYYKDGKVSVGDSLFYGAFDITGQVGTNAGAYNFVYNQNVPQDYPNANSYNFYGNTVIGNNNIDTLGNAGDTSNLYAYFNTIIGAYNLKQATEIQNNLVFGSSNLINVPVAYDNAIIGNNVVNSASFFQGNSIVASYSFDAVGITNRYIRDVRAMGNGVLDNNRVSDNVTAIGTNIGRRVDSIVEHSTLIGELIFGRNSDLLTPDTISRTIAIGDSSLFESTKGTNILAIGNKAGYSNTFNNVILIGNDTEATVDNEVVLGNGTKQLTSGNFKFNVDQDTTGLDGYGLKFNSNTGQIELGEVASSVIVDSIYLFGDGTNVNPITFSTEKLQDTLNAYIKPGLGVETDYDDVNGELLIQSLSIEDSVYNGTLDVISKGTPLYADSIQGNYWSVAPARADDPTKMPVVAIAGENIAAGQQGLGLLKGHIKGVNTETFASGDEVWVGATGGYTNIKPKGEGVLVQKLGTVIKANANGSGIINLGEVQYNLNPGNIFIGGADSVQTTTQYIIDSTRLNSIGDTAYYYQNGDLVGKQAITAAVIHQQEFTAVANDSSYTVSTNLPVNIDNILVFQNGQVLDKNMFTKLVDTITLNFQPEVGDRIVVMWFKGNIIDIGGNFVTLDQTETITGAKTFTNTFTQSNGDANFDSGTLFVDEDTDRVGIGTTSPAYKLDVNGTISNNSAQNIIYSSYDAVAALFQRVGQYGSIIQIGRKDVSNSTTIDYPADGTFAVSTAGSERMRIDAAGNVGIGTTSPLTKGHFFSGTSMDQLSVDGIGAIEAGINFKNGGTTYGQIYFNNVSPYDMSVMQQYTTGSLVFGTNDTERMRINSSGNVGIGTDSPSSKLTVVGDGNGTVQMGSAGFGSNWVGISLSGTLNTANYNILGSQSNSNFYLNRPSGGDMLFRHNNTDQVIINSSGNVGIGTSIPETKLHIIDLNPYITIKGSNADYSNAGIQLISGNASNARALGIFHYVENSDVEWFAGLQYTNNDAYVINRNTGYTIPSSQSSPPGIGASSGTLFIIDSSGNLGLGVTPSAWGSAFRVAMQLGGGASITGASGVGGNAPTYVAIGGNYYLNSSAQPIYIANVAASRYEQNAGEHYWSTAPSGTAGSTITFTERMRIDASGNVGINQPNPSEKLDVVGNVEVDGKIALNDGGNSVFIGDGAGLHDNGNNNFNVAVGYQALYNSDSTIRNTANGYSALYTNTSGSYNTANGFATLYFNETGERNVANGYTALYFNETGSRNTATGNEALTNLISGDNNQAYGSEAGRYYGSGSSALTNANGSLFLGSNTRASADSNSNEIVIGTNAIGNGSNSITLGASTNTKTILNGNVGIGTTSATTRLTIGGYSSANQTPDIQITRSSSGTAVQTGPNITFTDGITNNTTTLQVTEGRFGVWNYGSGSWNERMSIDTNGNVGIGTTNITDPQGFGRALEISAPIYGGILYLRKSGSPSYSYFGYDDTSLSASFGAFGTDTKLKFVVGTGENDNNPVKMILDALGNLGLGVSPSNALTGANTFEIGANGILYSETASSIYNSLIYGVNFYYDAAGNVKYKNTGVASSRYSQYQGSHLWYNAPADTADNLVSFTERMRIDISGNVGIGTTGIPSAKLHVVGASGAINGTGMTYLNNTDDAFSLVVNNAGNSSQNDRGVFEARVGTNSVFRINNSGNVGIGTTSPDAKFQVDANLCCGNTDWFLFNDTDGGGFFKASDGTNTQNITLPYFELQGRGDFGTISNPNVSYGGAFVAYKDSLATENASDIVFTFDARKRAGINGTIDTVKNGLTYFFANNGVPQLVIKANGNVGIGTSSPNARLTVEDDVTGASTLRLNNTNSGGALYMTKGATDIMFNGSADTWTGGGSTNDAALGAYQSNIKFFTANNGTVKAKLDASGNWDILGTTGSLSDIRSKKNIKYLNSSLQNVLLLKPVFYTSIYDIEEKEKIGFIAQDVQEIYPELVNNYGAENLLSLNYTGLIPVLTKAIQEQQAIIETQQTEITNLKTENQNLNTLIQTLITRIEALENK